MENVKHHDWIVEIIIKNQRAAKLKSLHLHADLQLQQHTQTKKYCNCIFSRNWFSGYVVVWFGEEKKGDQRQTIYMSLNFNYGILARKLITVLPDTFEKKNGRKYLQR